MIKKLTGGLALASMAATGCSDSRVIREGEGGRDAAVPATSQQRFDSAVADLCGVLDRCGYYDADECAMTYGSYGDGLSDACLQGYAILLDCYVDAIGPGCPDDTVDFDTVCASALEEAVDLCPMLQDE